MTGDRAVFEPGHKYRFAVQEGATVGWWRVGKKEDVMGSPGEPVGLDEASGGPIVLGMESVDLAVV
ncbi:hypothetical protein N7475_007091 [Penicillium sp. IBT 31633x]|nr:hypothetical protein N7475_007091 [Penicillium sp. IBT 31633x]